MDGSFTSAQLTRGTALHRRFIIGARLGACLLVFCFWHYLTSSRQMTPFDAVIFGWMMVGGGGAILWLLLYELVAGRPGFWQIGTVASLAWGLNGVLMGVAYLQAILFDDWSLYNFMSPKTFLVLAGVALVSVVIKFFGGKKE